MHRVLRRLAAFLIAGLLLTACGSSSSSRSTTATPAAPAVAAPVVNASVSIAGYKFAPAAVALKRGGTVTFTNGDPTAHTATANTAGFDTGTLQQGQKRTVTFGTAGTFAYHCVFHAFMTGSIVVS